MDDMGESLGAVRTTAPYGDGFELADFGDGPGVGGGLFAIAQEREAGGVRASKRVGRHG